MNVSKYLQKCKIFLPIGCLILLASLLVTLTNSQSHATTPVAKKEVAGAHTKAAVPAHETTPETTDGPTVPTATPTTPTKTPAATPKTKPAAKPATPPAPTTPPVVTPPTAPAPSTPNTPTPNPSGTFNPPAGFSLTGVTELHLAVGMNCGYTVSTNDGSNVLWLPMAPVIWSTLTPDKNSPVALYLTATPGQQNAQSVSYCVLVAPDAVPGVGGNPYVEIGWHAEDGSRGIAHNILIHVFVID